MFFGMVRHMFYNLEMWQFLLTILTVFCAAFTLKKTIVDKLFELFKRRQWIKKSPDIIKRIEDDIEQERNERKEETRYLRIELEAMKLREQDRATSDAETKTVLTMVARGVFALLKRDETLIIKATEEMVNNMKF